MLARRAALLAETLRLAGLSLRRRSYLHAEHVFVAGISSPGSTRGWAMANDKLTTYKAKRDFRKTREPSGQDAVKPTTRRRFVIQKCPPSAPLRQRAVFA
jgi:hypothetical protein